MKRKKKFEVTKHSPQTTLDFNKGLGKIKVFEQAVQILNLDLHQWFCHFMVGEVFQGNTTLTLKRQYDNGQYMYNYVQLPNCVISYNCKPKKSCVFVRTSLSFH